jgi:hypothetical protein
MLTNTKAMGLVAVLVLGVYGCAVQQAETTSDQAAASESASDVLARGQGCSEAPLRCASGLTCINVTIPLMANDQIKSHICCQNGEQAVMINGRPQCSGQLVRGQGCADRSADCAYGLECAGVSLNAGTSLEVEGLICCQKGEQGVEIDGEAVCSGQLVRGQSCDGHEYDCASSLECMAFTLTLAGVTGHLCCAPGESIVKNPINGQYVCVAPGGAQLAEACDTARRCARGLVCKAGFCQEAVAPTASSPPDPKCDSNYDPSLTANAGSIRSFCADLCDGKACTLMSTSMTGEYWCCNP